MHHHQVGIWKRDSIHQEQLDIFYVRSMHYFPLDGVLAERLFVAFDKDRNGHIDCDEFLGV